MDIRVIRGDGISTPHNGTSFAHNRHGLRVILGGKYVSPLEEKLREKIQEIYKEADDYHGNKVAGILLETYRLASREKWIFAALCGAMGVALGFALSHLFF